MKIVFDCDGVLVDFYKGFWRLAHDMFNTPQEGNPDDWTWDNYGIGLAPDQADRVWNRIKRDRGLRFWARLDPLVGPEERERIKRLNGEHELYFVTSRVGPAPKAQTEIWLYAALDLHFPTVIVSSRKGEICAGVGANYSIEDKAGNAVYIAYQSPKTKSYLLDAPYNRFEPSVLGRKVRRVKSVSEFLDDVEAGR